MALVAHPAPSGGLAKSEAADAGGAADLCGDLARLCVRGRTDEVLALLSGEPDEGADLASSALDAEKRTALHLAALGGHLRLAQSLLERRCEVNAQDRRRSTPLHVACAEDCGGLALELLLWKADANAEDAALQTPLHKAVLGSAPEVLKILLDYGAADPTLGDADHSTPLLLAAGLGRLGHLRMLLDHNPDLANACLASGWTALHLAAQGREMKKSSMVGAKFGAAVKLLLESKAAVDAADEDQKTPLHRAAAAGNSETSALLLEAGANVMADDITRWTPLHFACQDGHMEVARLLLRSKAAVQRENPPCLTPLAVATMENQVKIAELLMSHKADPNLRGKGLASPIMIARKDPEKYGELRSLFELGFISHAD